MKKVVKVAVFVLALFSAYIGGLVFSETLSILDMDTGSSSFGNWAMWVSALFTALASIMAGIAAYYARKSLIHAQNQSEALAREQENRSRLEINMMQYNSAKEHWDQMARSAWVVHSSSSGTLQKLKFNESSLFYGEFRDSTPLKGLHRKVDGVRVRKKQVELINQVLAGSTTIEAGRNILSYFGVEMTDDVPVSDVKFWVNATGLASKSVSYTHLTLPTIYSV